MPASRASGPSQTIWSVPALVEKLAPDLRVLESFRQKILIKGRTETYWVTIFKGLLVGADFHKHFKSEVIVTPDFAESTFGRLGRMFQKLGGNLEEMENPEFEKAFVVRATDPIESRYNSYSRHAGAHAGLAWSP